MTIKNCDICGSLSASRHLKGDQWICRVCCTITSPAFYFKEMGVENPRDPKGSTAHVRDIKNRRLDVKTNKMFYYEAPKTYFFPKG